MIDEKIKEIAAEAEREIAEILQPQGGRFGTGASPPPPFRPVMQVIEPAAAPETPPEATQQITPDPEPLHQMLERHNTKLTELLGFVSLTINDLEERIGKRLDEIERVLGVTKP